MDSIGMRMVACLGNKIGNVMQNNNPIENNKENQNKYTQREVIKKHNCLSFAEPVFTGKDRRVFSFLC
ncbi:hypothetical protein D3C78_1355630 [compost metagenome]